MRYKMIEYYYDEERDTISEVRQLYVFGSAVAYDRADGQACAKSENVVESIQEALKLRDQYFDKLITALEKKKVSQPGFSIFGR